MSGPSNEPILGPSRVPPFDAEAAAVLSGVGDFLRGPISHDKVRLLRETLRDLAPSPTDEHLSRGGRFLVEEHVVAGDTAGAPDVHLLVCTPAAMLRDVPVLYYMHGGGMVSGDNRTNLDEILDIAEHVQAAVVSVDYRLAPETSHPGQVDDCYAGFVWTVEQGPRLRIDPTRVVLVGASAGGFLAANVALRARDHHGPAALGQMLVAPMLDDRNDSFSARQLEGIGVWDRASNASGWAHLLGDQGDASSFVSPARVSSLVDLPQSFLEVGSVETFRDEVVAFAGRLWRAGCAAELHVWPGGYHGYYSMAPHAQLSRDTIEARTRWLRRLLAP